ncbi:MAG TPA: DUF4129 domain-containing protein [Ktedonobacterales bacterium]|nr:DUF4129 domain-containing protein [Ktedonobacterales bacterium]
MAIDVPAAGTVRAIYRDLLGKSAAMGLARQGGETAAEFERRMATTLAGAAGANGTTTPPAEPADALGHLTQAYEHERYGALAATPDRFARARLLLRTITGALSAMPRKIGPRHMHSESHADRLVGNRPAWDLKAIIALLLTVQEPLYIHFLPNIVVRGNHGLAMSLITLAEGLLAVALPVTGLALAHQVTAAPKMRLRAINRVIAIVALALGYVLLTVAIFTSAAIVLGALGNIFADL